MEIPSPEITVDAAKNVDSTFIDFKRFEGDSDYRAEQRQRFFGGKLWTPDYDYPKLDELYDFTNDADTDKTKRHFY